MAAKKREIKNNDIDFVERILETIRSEADRIEKSMVELNPIKKKVDEDGVESEDLDYRIKIEKLRSDMSSTLLKLLDSYSSKSGILELVDKMKSRNAKTVGNQVIGGISDVLKEKGLV